METLLSSKIKELRVQLGYARKDLAVLLSSDQRNIMRWETRHAKPRELEMEILLVLMVGHDLISLDEFCQLSNKLVSMTKPLWEIEDHKQRMLALFPSIYKLYIPQYL
jgi:transcriptional regulator with XRE-family HTH domain